MIVSESCTARKAKCRSSIVFVDRTVKTTLFGKRDVVRSPNEFKCGGDFIVVRYEARSKSQSLVDRIVDRDILSIKRFVPKKVCCNEYRSALTKEQRLTRGPTHLRVHPYTLSAGEVVPETDLQNAHHALDVSVFPQTLQALLDFPNQRIVIFIILISGLPGVESEVGIHLECSSSPFFPALGGIEAPMEEPLLRPGYEGDEEFPSADDLTGEDVKAELEVDDQKDQALLVCKMSESFQRQSGEMSYEKRPSGEVVRPSLTSDMGRRFPDHAKEDTSDSVPPLRIRARNRHAPGDLLMDRRKIAQCFDLFNLFPTLHRCHGGSSFP